jgi:hypothetical protein
VGKILNFDNFMAEKKKETISVTVIGKEYVVPMEIPAIVPVMMARAENANDPTANTRMVMRAADAMFGEANVNQMCADGLSAANLAMLVQQLFKEINEGAADDDDEVEELTDDDSRRQTGEGKRAKK